MDLVISVEEEVSVEQSDVGATVGVEQFDVGATVEEKSRRRLDWRESLR